MSVAPVELTDPLDLGPDPLALPEEISYHRSVASEDTGGNLLAVAAALGAAFFGYRMYMQRRLREESKGKQLTAKQLKDAVERIYDDYSNIWTRTVLPHLVSGYADGLVDVATGNIPEEVLLEIAEGYAVRLGEHLNQVSSEAVVRGYQAQLNRKVPPAKALGNVLDAFGVPPRAMNTLVNVWTSEEPKIISDVTPIDRRGARGRVLIEQSLASRAKVLGDNESWSTREQAKQIVWMYGMQTGAISPDTMRRWVTAHDERVCPTCGPMDGVTMPIGERFQVRGHGRVWAPPLHPNCRCDVKLDLDMTGGMASTVKESVGKSLVAKAREAYVRTPEGAARYNQPINSVIRADTKAQAAPKAKPVMEAQRRNRFAGMPLPDYSLLSKDELDQNLRQIEHVLSTTELTPEEMFALAEQIEGIESALQANQPEVNQITDIRPVAEQRVKVDLPQTRKKVDLKREEKTQQRVKVDLDTKQERVTVDLPQTSQRVKIDAPTQTRQRVKVDIDPEQRTKVDTERAKVSLPRKAPKGENPGLLRLERPAYAVVEPGSIYIDRNRLGREIFLTDERNNWTTLRELSWTGSKGRPTAADDVERYWRWFNKDELDAHWEAFSQVSASSPALSQGVVFLDDWDSQAGEAEIPRSVFNDVWKWVLRGSPREGNLDVDLLVHGAHDRVYEDSVDYDLLSVRFGFDDLLETSMPVVMETEYVDTFEQEYDWAPGANYGHISGRWKFMEESGNGLSGVSLPHRLVQVAPEHMDE